MQTSGSTIYRTKKRFVEIRLDAALNEEPRPGAARKLSGKEEVQLVALAKEDVVHRQDRWRLHRPHGRPPRSLWAWEHRRTESGVRIRRMFSTDQASRKAGLYITTARVTSSF